MVAELVEVAVAGGGGGALAQTELTLDIPVHVMEEKGMEEHNLQVGQEEVQVGQITVILGQQVQEDSWTRR